VKAKDIILAGLSGILTALAFPKFNLFFLGWISLIPLLLALNRKKGIHSFFLGWIAGSLFYAVLLYWIPAVPAHYGGLSLGLSLLTYILFFLFLGLFWALFAVVYSRINRSFPKSSYLIAPFIWVTFEFIITHFLTGFPWGILGYSQYKNLYFIQMTTLTGIYGLSLILILFQSLFLKSIHFRTKLPFFSAVALILLIHIVGGISIGNISQTPNSLSAAVIQGNVPAKTDFNSLSYKKTFALFNRHIKLSQEAISQDSELIIWPELSVPLCFTCNFSFFNDFKDKLFYLAEESGSYFLLGTSEIKLSAEKNLYFNSAVLLSPDRSTSYYHKKHLVPFGEYTPYKKIFSFISNFTHAVGELTPGDKYILHEFKGVKFGTPICYEIIFPDLVRRFVKKGAQFLVTITNDGWYGKSSAPYQHFAIAVIRAVENRRFVLRSATTGISGIIDPYGRILSSSKLDTPTFLKALITPSDNLTLYTRFGGVLPCFSLTLSLLFFILAVFKKYDRKNKYSKNRPF